MDRIVKVVGREILNAKGKPTIEAKVFTENGFYAFASAPSGTSRGKYEAHELYDGGARYGGFGTKTAAENINTEINDALIGVDVCDQKKIDSIMIELDGTPNKERLGGNAIVAVSMAAAKAAAESSRTPLYKLLAGGRTCALPDIIATVISGGEYSPSGLEFEDYLYIFHDYETFEKMLEDLVAVRKQLEKILREKFGDFPEDGGALAPPVKTSAEAFYWMMKAAGDVGCADHVSLGLDVAASELYDEKTGKYKAKGTTLTREQLTDYYIELCRDYPLTYIEDPFNEDDFEAHRDLKEKLPEDVRIIGDDLFVTNVERLKTGIEMDCATTLLLKVNQIGTVTEAIAANDMALDAGMDVTVSMRSGDTPEDFISDLAVAIAAKQIKLGSPVRAERTSKYNRLLEIEAELKHNA